MKNKQDNFEEVLDNILEKQRLNYSDLDIANKNLDVIKSYNSLNKKINQNPGYLKNLWNIFSSFNFNLVMKPLYTAVLTTVVIIAFLEFENINNLDYTEITVDEGEKIKLHVTDEIKIWVNSGSSIKVPLKTKRNLNFILDGEAYFEIKKNKGKAIKIISEGIEFKVLQASFNINSKNDNLVTNIKKGEVKLRNPELPKSTELNLVKFDKVLYNPALEFIAVEKEQSMNYLTWHTGKLSFNNTPMYEVIQDISDFYEIPISIANLKILKSNFNAQFKNASIDEILDKIQLTFNCEISGDGSKIIIN